MNRWPHECTVERQTQTNTNGEIITSWAVNETGVRCWIQEQLGTLVFGQSGAGLEYDAICFFRPGVDLQPQASDDIKDRIKITKPARFGSAYFLVLHAADEPGTEDHIVAFLKRVKGKS